MLYTIYNNNIIYMFVISSCRRVFKTLNDPTSSCLARYVSYLLTLVILLTAARGLVDIQLMIEDVSYICVRDVLYTSDI